MWRESFDGFEIGVERIVDGDDRVVVLLAATGSGRGSGVDVRTPTFAQLWTFEGDQVIRVEMLSEALETVGLWK